MLALAAAALSMSACEARTGPVGRSATVASTPASASAVGPAEYAVLSALLRAEVIDEERSYLLISDSTQKLEDFRGTHTPEAIATRLRLPVSVIHEYNRLNERHYPLRQAFALGSRTEMMSAAGLDSLNGERWQAFGRRHPGSAGVALVSRVAFTPDGKTAVASYTVLCGGLCGTSALVRLDLTDGEWKATAYAMQLVS
ncbi:hypothetical protein FHS01_000141 [Longimicrobium terrae]|uniref:Uncharacterized protein n=2 Tax=Longimicrobium terrae TaxID=1639882 RepID=A0A841GVQ0_9BACT|nr:hypothetical protein [Longimicrobium terrae]MBB6068975.1 hypothetical protein [Longimicrobium terrae]NNC28154.1 hypothetical protein [Longimicrobium terrae]